MFLFFSKFGLPDNPKLTEQTILYTSFSLSFRNTSGPSLLIYKIPVCVACLQAQVLKWPIALCSKDTHPFTSGKFPVTFS